jgi:hypothetical protein
VSVVPDGIAATTTAAAILTSATIAAEGARSRRSTLRSLRTHEPAAVRRAGIGTSRALGRSRISKAASAPGVAEPAAAESTAAVTGKTTPAGRTLIASLLPVAPFCGVLREYDANEADTTLVVDRASEPGAAPAAVRASATFPTLGKASGQSEIAQRQVACRDAAEPAGNVEEAKCQVGCCPLQRGTVTLDDDCAGDGRQCIRAVPPIRWGSEGVLSVAGQLNDAATCGVQRCDGGNETSHVAITHLDGDSSLCLGERARVNNRAQNCDEGASK